ncbi:peptidylprolyl isomerase [Termitidicoccus mucosus]|uniref:Peptidylprolyl isomerase n=1 Tax=Termitidicoccus mucosus TaxID=1184151 RepID=A0A178IL76_9BACT|nr:peptidylprolyl isomerase [Opitutaceae bacterium TSB47]
MNLLSLCRRAAGPRHAFLLLLAALSGSLAAADDGVLARVSDTEVRVDEIRASLENLDPAEQAALARNPALLNQAVRALLARKIVLSEAAAKKWDKNPAFAAQLEKLRENALVEGYLQAVSQPPEDFPAETEIEAVYHANKTALMASRQVRLAQIYVAAGAKTKLDAVTEQLDRPGADFAAIAKAESDDRQSAAQGGELGWLSGAQLRPEIRGAAEALAAGQTRTVELPDGWHILKALEVREARALTLDEVRVPLARRLRAERAQANRQAYLSKLLEENPVVINELALAELLPPAGP